MEQYISPTGTAAASGTLVDPWSLDQAIKVGGQYVMLPGTYRNATRTATLPLVLRAVDPVTVEPALHPTVWDQVQLGPHTVWHTAISAPRNVRQACWYDTAGVGHRIPVWNTDLGMLKTAELWAALVTDPASIRTKWGAWSTLTDLYLIPPDNGSWTDPNQVRITATADIAGLAIAGPGVELHGPITFIGHQLAVRMSGAARNAVFDGLTFKLNGCGIADIGTLPVAPSVVPTYGFGHHTLNCRFEDEILTSWFDVKSVLRSSESVGYYTEGGSTDSLVEHCVFDGTFDGFAHYHDSSRFDVNANKNLLLRHNAFRNIHDDSLDPSRYGSITIEDSTFENVGTIVSPAPSWGSILIRRCQGWTIGEQVRVRDGAGKRPPGSIVKMAAIDANKPRGKVRIEDSVFWTSTSSTQGLCPDGGYGPILPLVEVARSVIRVGGKVVNDSRHPTAWLTDDGTNVWSSSGAVKLETRLPIAVTDAGVVDARYVDPANGVFEETSTTIERLEAQLAEAQARIQELERVIHTARSALDTAA